MNFYMRQPLSASEFYIFCKDYNDYNSPINESTLVTDIAGYGDCIIDFLEAIDDEFGVNFVNFDFKKYFLDEIEIARSVFKLGHSRSIEEELTLGKLYEYINNNRK